MIGKVKNCKTKLKRKDEGGRVKDVCPSKFIPHPSSFILAFCPLASNDLFGGVVTNRPGQASVF